MNKQFIEELLKKISPWPWETNGDRQNVNAKGTDDWVCQLFSKSEEVFDGYFDNAYFIAQAPEIISSLLQELDQYRWRDVKDGLPEDSTSDDLYLVIASYENQVLGDGEFRSAAAYINDQWVYQGCRGSSVRGWMPLPSPNKEGDE